MKKPRTVRIACLLASLLSLSSAAFGHRQSTRQAAPKGVAPIKLQPKFSPGELMRYKIEVQSTSNTSHGGVVQDPQGPSNLVVTWDATVRLEALPAPEFSLPPGLSAGAVRVRTSYEKSSATVMSDTPDPAAEDIQEQYRRLEGQTIEFTMLPDGSVSSVHGLENILNDDSARAAAEQWIKQVSGGTGAPANGIVPGQTWSSDEPADKLPVAGMNWRTDSTYLRDEPCHPADPARQSVAPPPGSETCAVILTRLSLVAARKLRDVTPDTYRKNGVHTAGSWAGNGESLTYVSLRTGWVVDVTQNSTEQMDVTFTNATGATVQYKGSVGTHSQVSLLP